LITLLLIILIISYYWHYDYFIIDSHYSLPLLTLFSLFHIISIIHYFIIEDTLTLLPHYAISPRHYFIAEIDTYIIEIIIDIITPLILIDIHYYYWHWLIIFAITDIISLLHYITHYSLIFLLLHYFHWWHYWHWLLTYCYIFPFSHMPLDILLFSLLINTLHCHYYIIGCH
jgi:hypothetical protein